MKKTIVAIIIIFCALNTNAQNYKATYYHDKYDGRTTHSGEIFDQTKFTCASCIHKFGTLLKVTNKKNGKSVIVKVNDDGPLGNYKIDLSREAFKKIATLPEGVIPVTIEVIGFQTIKIKNK
jgi:rare lipoprotein A